MTTFRTGFDKSRFRLRMTFFTDGFLPSLPFHLNACRCCPVSLLGRDAGGALMTAADMQLMQKNGLVRCLGPHFPIIPSGVLPLSGDASFSPCFFFSEDAFFVERA